MSIPFDLVIIALGIAGFALAAYIHHKKRTKQHLVCPLRGSCAQVIHSNYSRFFGVSVELLGMLYYGFIAAVYALMLLAPGFATPLVSFLLVIVSTLAFLFSLYLVSIQVFSLKQICTWCLGSALFSALIFLMAVMHAGDASIAILAEYKRAVVGLHLLGMALGFGGALISDVFFFRSLKDYRISESEADTMSVLSQVIWVALAVLVISGVGLYLPEMARLNDSPKFLLKVIVVGVVIANGFLLNVLVAPKLIKINFGGGLQQDGGLGRMRKISFALGAISVTSWFSAFVLGMFRSSPLPFAQLLMIYLCILVLAISSSQIMERRLGKRGEVQ